MATIRSFGVSNFNRDRHLVKKGEYVLLVTYSEKNLSYDWYPKIEILLGEQFKIVYTSPVHYNNTHSTQGLQTYLLEKVA